MPPKESSYVDKESPPEPHALAKKFEDQIKLAIAEKFVVVSNDLSLLLSEPEGVYYSQKERGTLCCLVVDEKDGYMYLVTAKLTGDGKSLTNFKSAIVS